MMLKVTDVEYMGNYALLCRFNNGLQRYVDKEQFRQFGLDGTIFWANGADIAPEYLLENGSEWPPVMASEPLSEPDPD